eukprot:TRINITY_DN12361_c0_g2_i3.p1 TRINITY_DN12361_c0_g2~~TRINITY_DN12361_c0_g2_i3.p1  ORF type:complete len:658 (+),score=54.77 TRINITY_DN12361_c0_g2_i3:104-1975(+)
MAASADARYARRHGIPHLINDLLREVCDTRPIDPCAYLIEYLQDQCTRSENILCVPRGSYPDHRWGLQLSGRKLVNVSYGSKCESVAAAFVGRDIVAVNGAPVFSGAGIRRTANTIPSAEEDMLVEFSSAEKVGTKYVQRRLIRRQVQLQQERQTRWPYTLHSSRGDPQWPHSLADSLWPRMCDAWRAKAGGSRRRSRHRSHHLRWPNTLSKATWRREYGPASDATSGALSAAALCTAALGVCGCRAPPQMPAGLSVFVLLRCEQVQSGDCGAVRALSAQHMRPGEGLAALVHCVCGQAKPLFAPVPQHVERPWAPLWRPSGASEVMPLPSLGALFRMPAVSTVLHPPKWPSTLSHRIWSRREERSRGCCAVASERLRWPQTLSVKMRHPSESGANVRIGWPHTLGEQLWQRQLGSAVRRTVSRGCSSRRRWPQRLAYSCFVGRSDPWVVFLEPCEGYCSVEVCRVTGCPLLRRRDGGCELLDLKGGTAAERILNVFGVCFETPSDPTVCGDAARVSGPAAAESTSLHGGVIWHTVRRRDAGSLPVSGLAASDRPAFEVAEVDLRRPCVLSVLLRRTVDSTTARAGCRASCTTCTKEVWFVCDVSERCVVLAENEEEVCEDVQ